MSSNLRYILVLTLVCRCQGFCGEDDDRAKVPIVTVADSTMDLRVSWNGVFTGCQPNDLMILDAEARHISARNKSSLETINLRINPTNKQPITITLMVELETCPEDSCQSSVLDQQFQ